MGRLRMEDLAARFLNRESAGVAAVSAMESDDRVP